MFKFQIYFHVYINILPSFPPPNIDHFLTLNFVIPLNSFRKSAYIFLHWITYHICTINLNFKWLLCKIYAYVVPHQTSSPSIPRDVQLVTIHVHSYIHKYEGKNRCYSTKDDYKLYHYQAAKGQTWKILCSHTTHMLVRVYIYIYVWTLWTHTHIHTIVYVFTISFHYVDIKIKEAWNTFYWHHKLRFVGHWSVYVYLRFLLLLLLL